MKKTKMAVIAMSLATMSAAHASVYDFEGFTISFSGLDWSFDTSSSWTTRYDDYVYSALPSESYQTNGSGVLYNTASLSFTKTSLSEVQATGTGGTSSSSSSYSYTVQAKPGWQLDFASSFSEARGAYLEYQGGQSSITGSTSFTPSGGSYSYSDTSSVYRDANINTGTMQSGEWNLSGYDYAEGNSIVGYWKYIYDNDGNTIGYQVTHKITDDGPELINASGGGTLEMNATTSGFNQLAYSAETYGYLAIDAGALKYFSPVSPVPEPDTYAMMLLGLGMCGFVARRKIKGNRVEQSGLAAV